MDNSRCFFRRVSSSKRSLLNSFKYAFSILSLSSSSSSSIPEEQLRKAAELAVCKINIDSDIRLAMTGNIRKYFAEHPDHFDPRQYLTPARQAVKEMVAHKIQYVLGSEGKG